jgi:hypothetical protein
LLRSYGHLSTRAIPWRRAYSANAYPRDKFPVIVADARCVLCQQDLETAARERFGRFASFVIGAMSTKANAAEAPRDDALSRLRPAALPIPDLAKEAGDYLASLAPQLSDQAWAASAPLLALTMVIRSCRRSSIRRCRVVTRGPCTKLYATVLRHDKTHCSRRRNRVVCSRATRARPSVSSPRSPREPERHANHPGASGRSRCDRHGASRDFQRSWHATRQCG